MTRNMLLLKIKNLLSLKKLVAMLVLGALITIKLTGVLSAQTVTRGYASGQVLQRGMVVGLTKADASKIEPIDVTRANDILGVVVAANDSPITLSGPNDRVFVATTGRYDVLVSDQQGAIKTADYITVSSLGGIAMKANDQQSTVVGRAGAAFDGKTNVLSSTTLTDGSGKARTVRITRIAVEVSIGKNPLAKADSGTPAILSKAGRAITGKTVSAVRLYLGTIIFIVGTVIAGAILYAGIHSSIISIGRNPLSRKSIFRSMIGVAFTSLIVFVISVIGVYLLLKL